MPPALWDGRRSPARFDCIKCGTFGSGGNRPPFWFRLSKAALFKRQGYAPSGDARGAAEKALGASV
ncbi:hypothetical protein SBA4_1490004 [Candidatus Sulfopaludibacter sp. SbA4]|nr:hypothetical protein SBA4_1490004 [Candidatus Sulfopaludibacter sp. SbA4]